MIMKRTFDRPTKVNGKWYKPGEVADISDKVTQQGSVKELAQSAPDHLVKEDLTPMQIEQIREIVRKEIMSLSAEQSAEPEAWEGPRMLSPDGVPEDGDAQADEKQAADKNPTTSGTDAETEEAGSAKTGEPEDTNPKTGADASSKKRTKKAQDEQEKKNDTAEKE